jgi:hypothetical protein
MRSDWPPCVCRQMHQGLEWMLSHDVTDVIFESFSVTYDLFGETHTVSLPTLSPDGMVSNTMTARCV